MSETTDMIGIAQKFIGKYVSVDVLPGSGYYVLGLNASSHASNPQRPGKHGPENPMLEGVGEEWIQLKGVGLTRFISWRQIAEVIVWHRP